MSLFGVPGPIAQPCNCVLFGPPQPQTPPNCDLGYSWRDAAAALHTHSNVIGNKSGIK